MELPPLEYYDPQLERFKEGHRRRDQTIDYQCLRKYDLHNEHFSMEVVTINQEEKERLIGYNCVYRYGTHEIKLEYRISTQMWTIVSDTYLSEEEEKQLKASIAFFNKLPMVDMGYTLDKRIQFILRSFDNKFIKFNQAEQIKQNNEKMSKSLSISQKENGLECTDDELIALSSTSFKDNQQQPKEGSLTSENDVIDDGLHPSITNSRLKFSELASPPVASRCYQQNRTCNAQTSVPWNFFIPPAPVGRRRVIELIVLDVQRKKRIFEKFCGMSDEIEPSTMHDLGFKFLHIYNGKFNYRKGHRFVISFRKNIWFLTIEQLKYIDCPVGSIGPPSLLLLNYEGHYTTVHV